MLRSLKKLAFVPVLLLAITACETAEDSSILPTSPEPLIGSLLGGGSVNGYTLVRDPLLPGILNAVSAGQLIGFNGGTISLLGHTLVVPVGAVSKPTLFTLAVLPTGYVEVDLSATLSTLLGPLDVGGKGFQKLVPVSLTYARATNVSNPSTLKILRVNSLIGYSSFEVMPSTVNQTSKIVTTQLDHFSRYTMAYPD